MRITFCKALMVGVPFFLLACESVTQKQAPPINDFIELNAANNQKLPPVPGLTITLTNDFSHIVQDIGLDGRWDGRWDWRLVDSAGQTIIEIDRNEDGEPDVRISNNAENKLELSMDQNFDGEWQTAVEPIGENWLDASQSEKLPSLARSVLCITLDPFYCGKYAIPLWRTNYLRRVLAGYALSLPVQTRDLRLADYCLRTDDPGCRQAREDDPGSTLIGDGSGTPVVPLPATPVCGPKVTTQVLSTLNDIKNQYRAASTANQTKMCGHVFSFDRQKYLNAFDIMPLFLYQQCWRTGLYPGCSIPSQASSTMPCEYTVEFGGGCYHSAVVNYMMFGVIGHLCGKKRLYLVGLHLAYDMTKRWANIKAGKGNKGDPNLSQQSLMMNLGYQFAGGTSQSSLENTIAANKRLMQANGNKFKHYYHCNLTCPTSTALQPDPPPWPFTLEPTFPRASPTLGTCSFP